MGLLMRKNRLPVILLSLLYISWWSILASTAKITSPHFSNVQKIPNTLRRRSLTLVQSPLTLFHLSISLFISVNCLSIFRLFAIAEHAFITYTRVHGRSTFSNNTTYSNRYLKWYIPYVHALSRNKWINKRNVCIMCICVHSLWT